jgi:hypothetical protein
VSTTPCALSLDSRGIAVIDRERIDNAPADLPLDLRYKKTRAIRRRLTKHESHLITEKQHKKDIHFPKRSESATWNIAQRTGTDGLFFPYFPQSTLSRPKRVVTSDKGCDSRG